MELVRSRTSGVRVPSANSLVYKDECMFSFDTPFSAEGLAVNLGTWHGVGEPYWDLDHKRSGMGLYLLQKWKSVPKPQEELDAEKELAGTGAIIIPGSERTIEKEHALLLMPERTLIPYSPTDEEIPTIVLQACNAIISHEGSAVIENAAAFVEDFVPQESKYARELEQLPANGKRVSSDPKKWVCDETGVTENLWLNLSTGFIGSGRKHFDGSGGNGAAERHWEGTGCKYPLVVKLGTITPNGADVFSYAKDENDMVIDPLLVEHLKHWGIDIMQMEKTEKTMAELQVTLNLEHDWSKITEENGREMEALSGPGLVGMANLGNSCYMNSVLQCLFNLSEIQARYVAPAETIFASAPANPADDVPTQLAKVGVGLTGGRYAAPVAQQALGDTPVGTDDVCVRPLMLRTVVGRGHAEYSTGRQQDAAAYLVHLLEMVARAEHANRDRLNAACGALSPSALGLFEATMETRTECLESKQVRYTTTPQALLGLHVPMDAAANTSEYKAYQEQKRAKTAPDDTAPVVAKVSFEACLGRYFGDEVIPDFMSSALNRKAPASLHTRFVTFPRYLLITINRYYMSDTWEPKKLEVEVPAPLTLDLEAYRSPGGIQPGEVALPDDAAEAAPAPAIDHEVVTQLMGMGFSENGCMRAVQAVGSAGVEAASEWIFAHMEDADFNDPLPQNTGGGGGAAASSTDVSADAVQQLTPLGFSEEQARAALISTKGDPARAADWLFSHMDNLDGAVAGVLGAAEAPAASGDGAAPAGADDGPGKYTLCGIVSHLGKNTGSGHYVCHVRKPDGSWVIFNDRKVGRSKAPPLDVGYLYFYRRQDVAE